MAKTGLRSTTSRKIKRSYDTPRPDGLINTRFCKHFRITNGSHYYPNKRDGTAGGILAQSIRFVYGVVGIVAMHTGS